MLHFVPVALRCAMFVCMDVYERLFMAGCPGEALLQQQVASGAVFESQAVFKVASFANVSDADATRLRLRESVRSGHFLKLLIANLQQSGSKLPDLPRTFVKTVSSTIMLRDGVGMMQAGDTASWMRTLSSRLQEGAWKVGGRRTFTGDVSRHYAAYLLL